MSVTKHAVQGLGLICRECPELDVCATRDVACLHYSLKLLTINAAMYNDMQYNDMLEHLQVFPGVSSVFFSKK